MDVEAAAPQLSYATQTTMAENGIQTRKPLIGSEDATVDDKGRILFSKKKRERLGDDFAMLVGELGCIVCYPGEVWTEKVNEILSYDSLGKERQQYTRLFLSCAEDELNFDGQGRVVVPFRLREIAKLKNKVKVVGAGDRVEIWDAEEYETYLTDLEGYNATRRDALDKAYKAMKVA